MRIIRRPTERPPGQGQRHRLRRERTLADAIVLLVAAVPWTEIGLRHGIAAAKRDAQAQRSTFAEDLELLDAEILSL